MPETYTHDDNATTWRDVAGALSPAAGREPDE
jgi:hypothetical protein